MKIEKVTKYVIASSPSRSTSDTYSRMIPMSLPRVRWIERDDEFGSASKFQSEQPPIPRDQKEKKSSNGNAALSLRIDGLTPQEHKIYEMAIGGASLSEIATAVGLSEKRVMVIGRSIRRLKGDIEVLMPKSRNSKMLVEPPEIAFKVYHMIVEGMKYSEISSRLSVSKDTIRIYKHRVKAHLDNQEAKGEQSV